MESANAFVTIANIYVRDRNYTVHVSLCCTSHRIHVFKYDESRYLCEYEIFGSASEAEEYLELLL